ncbi:MULTISPECIES: MFS transporter [unclassified Acinetobacter]|uniref:MFS transporter n=1 Tax=unclassified Acinetobacter TaxID=196816 RepID=UPI00190C21D6|nr:MULTISPECIES: MFS transporter [unclassified Acinetobacter]MBK0063997.1 MFS transporter [Acinetobacter sp. S55]MBK0067282.1 MFS transporter [Acinetobacter sp. S54]
MLNPVRLYLLLFSLYWAQGLPVGFMTHALPVILRAEGVSLTHIGGFGLLMLPWSIKIFWAPLVDRFGDSKIGHYRSWILPTQILSVVILVILSFFPIDSLSQTHYLFLFFILLLCLNLTGATQDIATDGLAVNLLKTDQQHWGNTFQVVGSRLGFIVGGGVLLWALDGLSWQLTFLGLALIVLINTIPVWFYKNEHIRTNTALQHAQLRFSLKDYFDHFTQSRELRCWLIVLISFKIADGLSGPLLKPLMVDMGLNFTQISVYITMLGAFAALCGAAIAGYLLRHYARPILLILFSYLKILSLLAYAVLAFLFEQKIKISNLVIYLINAVEDAISAMLLVVMLTLVMQYSRKVLAGTDFTFQVAIMATVGGGLYTVSGILGDWLGYAMYLSSIVGIALFCLIPLYQWKRCYLKTS